MIFRLRHQSPFLRLTVFARRYSYIPNRNIITHDKSAYVSTSTNPYFNLSLEDWLFKHKDHQKPLLLIYRNEPCVVIGRNQNPWKEVNLQLAASTNVPVIRRRSGGGTVYHDLGNTNYSVHVPRVAFDRNDTSKIVVRAVRSLGVDADVNERNDVCVRGYKICYPFQILNIIVLPDTDKVRHTKLLSSLGDLLHTTKETMVTKGVASVRSPVQNLQYFNPSVVHEAFENATIKAFQEHYNISEEVIYVEADAYSQVPEIQHSMDELQSWDWLFGQTPEFTYSFSQSFDWGEMKVEIRSKHGRITACDFKGRGVDQTVVRLIRDKAVGLRYGEMGKPEDLDWKLLEVPKSLQAQEIWNWIQAETSI